MNRKTLPIGPPELQIAYNLFLGSDKDFEDARFLFRLLREHLDEAKLLKTLKQLQIPRDTVREVLDWFP